uniref:inosine/xanthosine triphosphatase n=1 Tax=Chromera velia CCMP2878 TaxID=1169474 RepID=A0A0G4FTH0_9ALVE|eukprot:Cvel_3707.t1-p1 / transcript=Cvel_3707.t1 / gene=Cvel_3707 / organism=Chromera_velia_CCMP2878 / gene_product=Protein PRRC1, putative / transcript_product=Protein PRRC1, putative / location=Cvel_scaffold154:60871-61476(+) / protein_length=202 / sequence_SO=supercontig / SO=protein_coding / is_pseudo=false
MVESNTGSPSATRQPLCVLVTSANDIKLSGVCTAFRAAFSPPAGPTTEIQVVPRPADSGIPHGQPWGMQHTYEGALARLDNLKRAADAEAEGTIRTVESNRRPDYLVSVENGVVGLLSHTATTGVDVCCVIVEESASGRREFAFSQGRPYPLQEVQAKVTRGEGGIGKFVAGWYDERPELTVTRKCQVIQATAMALAQLKGP